MWCPRSPCTGQPAAPPRHLLPVPQLVAPPSLPFTRPRPRRCPTCCVGHYPSCRWAWPAAASPYHPPDTPVHFPLDPGRKLNRTLVPSLTNAVHLRICALCVHISRGSVLETIFPPSARCQLILFWGKQLINWKERWQVSTYWMENFPCAPGGRKNISLCHLGEKYKRLKRKSRKM